jgi:hypothetical protein
VNGPCYICGDNQSVLANTTEPGSTLKKKSQSIAYHFVLEGVAKDEWRTSYVNTHENEADLLTKLLPAGEKRRGFVRNLLHPHLQELRCGWCCVSYVFHITMWVCFSMFMCEVDVNPDG